MGNIQLKYSPKDYPHPPIEHDYKHHQDNPGPSEEAVKEYDRNGASSVLVWLIPLLVLALLVWWLIFRE